MAFRRLSLVLIFTLALGPVALADAPTMSIQQQATLMDPAGVIVTVVVNCGDGPSTIGEVEVAVRQGDSTGGSTDTFTPTGSRQEIEVFVPGLFTVGEASAGAILTCATMLSGFRLGATIKISD